MSLIFNRGVAISLFVRCASKEECGTVTHADLWGNRDTTPDAKYDWLAARDVESTGWAVLSPRSPLHLFTPRDEALIDEYEAAWSISKIFSPSGDPAPGIVTTHDQFAISWTRKEAISKVERLLATTSEEEAREIWRLCSQDQWQYDRAKRELADDSWHERIETVLYRPFDRRVTVFDRNVAVHRRERVMRHMLAGENLGLCIGRAGQVIGSDSWDVVFVSENASDFNLFRRGGNCLFPLYLSSQSGERLANTVNPRTPNLDAKFTRSFASAVGLEFIPDGAGDRTSTFGPEDIFHYLYAVLHSPEYRRRYADFLKSDFPRIPLPAHRAVFSALILPGARLVSLHLMEAEDERVGPAFPSTGSNQVERVRCAPPSSGLPGCVWINREQYFESVTPEIWAFTIGGYRPAEKWLKDRKGRTLSEGDIDHYRKIVAALTDTRRLMAEIDEVVGKHGGWPGAFQTGDAPKPATMSTGKRSASAII